MGMPIKDGRGSGRLAEVDAFFRLLTSTNQMSRQAFISRETGEAFSWTAATADLAAADTALLVANVNTAGKLLHITKTYVYSDVPTRIQFHVPAYPTLAGTAVTGVCLNRAKALDPASYSLAYADETGNTQGSIILVLDTNELTTDQFGVLYDFEGSVILPYKGCFGIDIVGDSAAFDAHIEGYFE